MKIEDAVELVTKRMQELEFDLTLAESNREKRQIMLNIQSGMQMLCYLDQLKRGITPRFIRVIDTELTPLNKQVLA